MKSLGRFHLMGIAPAPRGVPQIEVAFDIDANGIVNVSAKDLATGKEQAMTITGGTALSKDEVDRMVADAEKFAAEDHARREAAEARNQADQLTYQVDKFVEENGDKVADADKTELAQKNDELKEVLKAEDAEAAKLRAATEATMQVFQRVGQAMYEQQQAAQAAPSEAPGRRAPTPAAGRDRVRGRRRRGRDRRRRGCLVSGPDRERRRAAADQDHGQAPDVRRRRSHPGREAGVDGPPLRADDGSSGDVASDLEAAREEAARVPRPPPAAAGGVRQLPQAGAEGADRRGRARRGAGVQRLLEVLDDFELALMAATDKPDFDRFLHGVELVYAKLVDTLKAEGLERIEAEGKPFDPEQHEALMQTGEGDGDLVVADVLRPGYTLRGRVIRPAGVRVNRE